MIAELSECACTCMYFSVQVSNVSEVRASDELLLSGAMGVNVQGRQIHISANGGIMISSQVNHSCMHVL